jgi:hypothetical protein
MESYECVAPVDLFARVLVYPNHFDSKRKRKLEPIKSLFPRPDSDKDGVSLIKCVEIKTIENLIGQGENIIKGQKNINIKNKLFDYEPLLYGCLFMLEDIINQDFDLFQKGGKLYHYVLKHKEVNYKETFPYDKIDVVKAHKKLLGKSLVKTASELEGLAKNPNNWEIIHQELMKLTQI